MRKKNFFYVFLLNHLSWLFTYSYDVFAHKRSSRLQVVHQILVAELSLIFIAVVHSIPWFKTDEWCVLAIWSPYAHTGSVEAYCHHRTRVLGVEYFY